MSVAFPAEASHRDASPPLALDSKSWLGHAVVLFGAVFAILASRSWTALVLPELALEDGKEMLGFYFNRPDPMSIFRFYNGYMILIPDLIAWAAARGPLTWAPYVFTLSSLALASLGIVLTARPAFAWLLPSAKHRAILALLLALMPLGRGLLIHNLDYSIWSVLFLLFVLLGAPLPKSKWSLAAHTSAVILCIFSHALSLLAAPLCLVHLWMEKARLQKACSGLCLLAIAAYQIWGVTTHSPSR